MDFKTLLIPAGLIYILLFSQNSPQQVKKNPSKKNPSKKKKTSKHRRVRIKVGTRVTNAPMQGQWGTVIEIKDLSKEAKTLSEKLRENPKRYVVLWDNGKVETLRKDRLWFHGDEPGFGRPKLIDPKSKK